MRAGHTLESICFLRPVPSHPQPRKGTAYGVQVMSVQQRMPRKSYTPRQHRVQDPILLALCHVGSELRASQFSPNFPGLVISYWKWGPLLLSWKTYQALWRKCHTFGMPVPTPQGEGSEECYVPSKGTELV